MSAVNNERFLVVVVRKATQEAEIQGAFSALEDARASARKLDPQPGDEWLILAFRSGQGTGATTVEGGRGPITGRGGRIV